MMYSREWMPRPSISSSTGYSDPKDYSVSTGLQSSLQPTQVSSVPSGEYRNCPSNSLCFTVNLLPSADYIIALGSNGEVVEQGTFEELNKSNGYVRSFSVQQSKEQFQNTEPAGKSTLGPMPTSALVDAMDDKKRQLGDLTVYMYYFRTLGKTVSFLFVFFAASHGFFYSFPSKPRLWLVT
jgi:hypothetical protein